MTHTFADPPDGEIREGDDGARGEEREVRVLLAANEVA